MESYQGATLTGRQVYGRGLDEIVEQHRDLDGDGSLESQTVPVYDSSGNLSLLARADGSVLERYSYTAFGARDIRVDATAPAIHQVRTVGGQIWIELTEEVSREHFTQALANGEVILQDLSQDPPSVVPLQLGALTTTGSGTIAVSQVATGEGSSGTLTMSATSTEARSYRDPGRRRLILDLPSPPAVGTALRLTVPGAALVDAFLNRSPTDFAHDFSWPSADTVLHDTAAPEVFSVQLRGEHLELTFTEEPDLASAASAITVDTSLTWSLSTDRLTLRSQETLAAGTYTLAVSTTLADLVATPLASTFQQSLTIEEGQTDTDFFLQPDNRVVATSTVANTFGFHGLPKDTETGLVYVRNRHYDPQLGRFLQPDPLGYVDGPNVYQYGLNSPVNFSDPMGLCTGKPGEPEECVSWWPYFPPGVAAQATENYRAQAEESEAGRLSRAVSGTYANVTGLIASAEDEVRLVLNAPHHFLDRWRDRLADQQGSEEFAARVRELKAELGCTVCAGDDLRVLYESLEAEFGSPPVAGPGFAMAPIGPGRLARGSVSRSARGANAQVSLARKLKALEGAQSSAVRTRTLPDGRIRYYGPEKAARKKGPTRGAALVTEHNPRTGQVRQWYENYDQAGDVIRVHPKLEDGQVLNAPHYPPTAKDP